MLNALRRTGMPSAPVCPKTLEILMLSADQNVSTMPTAPGTRFARTTNVSILATVPHVALRLFAQLQTMRLIVTALLV